MSDEFESFFAELVALVDGDKNKASAFLATWAGARIYIPNELIRQRDLSLARRLLSLGLRRAEIRDRLIAAGYTRDTAYSLLRKALDNPLRNSAPPEAPAPPRKPRCGEQGGANMAGPVSSHSCDAQAFHGAIVEADGKATAPDAILSILGAP